MPIDERHRNLWQRIAAHRFDDPAARLTFTARLARENGWTVGRAVRVVDEYRRFVFLAMTAGHPVTPSEDVDQAWHLHLAYTRDYWETFCRDVLGGPLHHGPTRGGAAEADRYDGQYRRTLAAYAAAFDADPPADIWPPAERRFGADLAWRRVNVARNWVIPKPAWLAKAPVFAIVPLVAVGIPNPLDFTAAPFLGLFAALATGSLVAGLVLRQMLRPAGDPTAVAADLEPLEVALLADDGRLRFAAAGLTLLAEPAPPAAADGAPAPPAFTLAAAGPATSSPLVAALRTRLEALGACTPVEAVKAVVEAAREEFEPRLVERGLLVGRWWSTPAPWIILAPALATIGLGVAKICVGISRGRPVGFLVIGCCVLAITTLLALARKPRRTRQADAMVHEAWNRYRASGPMPPARERTADVLPLAVALLGPTTLVGTPFAFLGTAVERLRPGGDGSAGGCGTSGGDGGGGGGCGGCGGCGGGGD